MEQDIEEDQAKIVSIPQAVSTVATQKKLIVKSNLRQKVSIPQAVSTVATKR